MNQSGGKPGRIEHFSQLLGRVIEGLARKERPAEEEIDDAWRRAVGEDAARHSRPVSLKRSNLTVNVANSSWLYELTVRKREIMGALEAELKRQKIKEIRFRIGQIGGDRGKK